MVSALLKSVARGWNVIDTARNYRRGRAEAAVGEALMTLTRQGLRREQLFISTKAGYLPGTLRCQRGDWAKKHTARCNGQASSSSSRCWSGSGLH